MSIPRFQSHFIANWRFGLLALFFCLLFVRLGFWQLARADEKKELLRSHHAQASREPITWGVGDVLPVQYQPVRVYGQYMPVTLLLDNQHDQHQVGYHVLTPLQIGKDKVVLIDRGFVPMGRSRDTLPQITIPDTPLVLKGQVYFPSDKNWSLGNIFDKKRSNVAIIELFDARVIGQFLHKSVYPFIIRLDPDATDGFLREWPVVAMPPERHLGYAVQWFAMAFVVLMLYIILNIKKRL
jgi:surfeit locus 1 family protein